ncbi:MAG: hypothetical protein AB1483_08195 [Candidatus Zixiibacteriota bacterium]
MSEKKMTGPITHRIAVWYGFIFAAIFLLYGGVKIILGFLDRNYADMVTPILFLVLGLILIAVAFAYKEQKAWGWYGLIVVNCLVVITAAAGIRHYENIILLIISGVVLYSLFAPATKQYLGR